MNRRHHLRFQQAAASTAALGLATAVLAPTGAAQEPVDNVGTGLVVTVVVGDYYLDVPTDDLAFQDCIGGTGGPVPLCRAVALDVSVIDERGTGGWSVSAALDPFVNGTSVLNHADTNAYYDRDLIAVNPPGAATVEQAEVSLQFAMDQERTVAVATDSSAPYTATWQAQVVVDYEPFTEPGEYRSTLFHSLF